jgi:hypothetical protein
MRHANAVWTGHGMKITVYATENLPLRFILTPRCMQPSADCVHQVGPIHSLGNLEIGEDLLNAISHHVPGFAGEFEYVVDGKHAIRYIEALLQGANLGEHPAGLAAASRNSQMENA